MPRGSSMRSRKSACSVALTPPIARKLLIKFDTSADGDNSRTRAVGFPFASLELVLELAACHVLRRDRCALESEAEARALMLALRTLCWGIRARQWLRLWRAGSDDLLSR